MRKFWLFKRSDHVIPVMGLKIGGERGWIDHFSWVGIRHWSCRCFSYEVHLSVLNQPSSCTDNLSSCVSYPLIVIWFFSPWWTLCPDLLSHHPVSPSTHLSTPILSPCHFPSSSHPTHIRLPNNFHVILLIHSAGLSFPPAGLVSLAVLGGDSSLESLIKHLQASALDHTHAQVYSVSTMHTQIHTQTNACTPHKSAYKWFISWC